MNPQLCPRPDKAAHTTKRAANAQRAAMGSRGRDAKPYRCTCGSWHVGNQPAPVRRRIRRQQTTRATTR